MIVTVDGPVAAGKGTLSRRLAADLGFAHLDTGMIYRAVGCKVMWAGGDPANEALALQDIHQPPDADPRAIVAPGVIQHVGPQPGCHGRKRNCRLVVVEVLDVGRDPHGDARAVRQRKLWPPHDRRILKASMLHDLIPSETSRRAGCIEMCRFAARLNDFCAAGGSDHSASADALLTSVWTVLS